MSQRQASDQCLIPSALSNIGPSQILPFLYVGCQEDALSTKTMQEYQITHVINVSTTGDRASFLNEDDNEHFLRIPINDCLNAQLLPYFNEAYLFIEKTRLNHGRVFIHCLAGISRSPTLAIAYIIRYLHLSAADAYRYVKQHRPQISPNFNFLGQLHEYEHSLSLESKSTATVTPIVKCVPIESPLNDRHHSIQIETRSNSDNSMKHRSSVLTRPTCFNFDSMKPRRSLALTSTIVERSVESQRSLLRQSDISIKRATSTDDYSTIQLINSSYDESMSNRRFEVVLKSADTFSSMDQSDLINTYYQESRGLPSSSEQCKTLQSHDMTNETLTPNVLHSSLEVLVL